MTNNGSRRLLAPLALFLFVLLAVYALGRYRYLHLAPHDAPPAARNDRIYSAPAHANANQVLAVDIYYERPDELVLDVEYVYTGDHGRQTFVGAMTMNDGSSTGHWCYVPAQLLIGRHRARINLRMNDDAPDTYTSDAVAVEFYVPRKSPFYTETIPLEKMWHRSTAAQTP